MRQTPAATLLALTGFALLLVGFSYMTGDLAAAEQMTEEGDRVVGHRAESLSGANIFGMASVWALASLAFLWRKAVRLWQQGVLIGLAVLLLTGAVFSGSRKAVLVAPVFLLAWVWFCYRRVMLRRAAVFGAVALAMVLFFLGASFVLRETYIGYRLQLAFSVEERDGSTERRLTMIHDGIKMLVQHPVSGVGLYQFGAYARHGAYAHNDYIEVAATTGFVGFSLYCAIFVLVARRLRRVRLHSPDPEVKYVAGLCLAIVVTCAVGGLAFVSSCSIEFWSFISGVIGFAYAAERKCSRHLGRGFKGVAFSPTGFHARFKHLRASRQFSMRC